MHIRFFHDVLNVALDGRQRDVKGIGNGGIGQPPADFSGHLDLPGGKAIFATVQIKHGTGVVADQPDLSVLLALPSGKPYRAGEQYHTGDQKTGIGKDRFGQLPQPEVQHHGHQCPEYHRQIDQHLLTISGFIFFIVSTISLPNRPQYRPQQYQGVQKRHDHYLPDRCFQFHATGIQQQEENGIGHQKKQGGHKESMEAERGKAKGPVEIKGEIGGGQETDTIVDPMLNMYRGVQPIIWKEPPRHVTGQQQNQQYQVPEALPFVRTVEPQRQLRPKEYQFKNDDGERCRVHLCKDHVHIVQVKSG